MANLNCNTSDYLNCNTPKAKVQIQNDFGSYGLRTVNKIIRVLHSFQLYYSKTSKELIVEETKNFTKEALQKLLDQEEFYLRECGPYEDVGYFPQIQEARTKSENFIIRLEFNDTWI